MWYKIKYEAENSFYWESCRNIIIIYYFHLIILKSGVFPYDDWLNLFSQTNVSLNLEMDPHSEH